MNQKRKSKEIEDSRTQPKMKTKCPQKKLRQKKKVKACPLNIKTPNQVPRKLLITLPPKCVQHMKVKSFSITLRVTVG